MKRILLICTFIFINSFLIVFFPSSTSACSCAEMPSVEEEFDRSKAVFSGRVIEIREDKGLNGAMSRTILFEINDTWKGVKESQVIITTGLNSADCGIDFKKGQEYLVYANESTMYGENSLVSTICSRTNELSATQEDLAILGEGKQPQQEVDLTGKSKRSQSFIWGTVVLVIGMILIFKIKKR